MLDYEKKFTNKLIAGVDEAGRGPLAGPVVCACVIMPLDKENIIDGINDSKKLSEKKREKLYQEIINKAIAYSIVEIDKDCIDEINILNATKLGMKKAVEALKIQPEIVLTDAVHIDIDIAQENIIKGDALSYNIASASILAKVYRDRKMIEIDKLYPQFGFAKHKGYGTSQHIKALKEFGKCSFHRESFIKNFKIDKKIV